MMRLLYLISTQEAAGNFLVENQTLVVAEPLPTLMKAPSSAPLHNIVIKNIKILILDIYLAQQMSTTAIIIAMITRTPAPTPMPMMASVESTFNKKELDKYKSLLTLLLIMLSSIIRLYPSINSLL